MTFFTQLDLDTDRWTIMCRSHGYAEVAGERLFRAPPHPEIKWSCSTEEEAIENIAKIKKYMDSFGVVGRPGRRR